MENKTVTNLCRAARIENTLLHFNCGRVIVDITDAPVLPEHVLDPIRMRTIRSTEGFYFLKYMTPAMRYANPKFPYVLGTDLLGHNIRLAGPNHLYECAKQIPEIAWLIRNTNINKDLFYWARRHPGELFYFSLNYGDYCAKIMKKAEELGYTKGNDYFKPLVVFRFTPETNNYIELDTETKFISDDEFAKKNAIIKSLANGAEKL